LVEKAELVASGPGGAEHQRNGKKQSRIKINLFVRFHVPLSLRFKKAE